MLATPVCNVNCLNNLPCAVEGWSYFVQYDFGDSVYCSRKCQWLITCGIGVPSGLGKGSGCRVVASAMTLDLCLKILRFR